MNKDLLNLKLKMLLSLFEFKKIEKLSTLYLEYIKKYVNLYNQSPKYNQKWQSINNCYFYALNISTPLIINIYSKLLTDDYFSINVGNIAGMDFMEQQNQNEIELLNCLYHDLNELNIKCYESTINTPNKYNGYKILVLYSDSHDYHFIRQNSDNLWSTKFGLEKDIFTSDNPLLLFNNPFDTSCSYKLVKCLEIVKPQ